RCRPMCTTPPGRLCFYRRRRKRASLGRRCLGSCVTASRFRDRKSTRLNSSHVEISYAVFCLKKKKRCIWHRCTFVTFSERAPTPLPQTGLMHSSIFPDSCPQELILHWLLRQLCAWVSSVLLI